MAERIATVFGGSGFIGRYVVKRLAAAGYRVRIAVRDTEAAAVLKPMGGVGQVVALRAPVTDAAAVAQAVAGAEVVVSLVGILAEGRPGDFQRIHSVGAGTVAQAASAAGVRRLVHVSALGVSAEHPSLYARSKAAGEAAVRAAFPASVILRPSLVFGPEDAFFNRFARIAQLSPVMPVIGGATRFQPVYVGDVADAVMAALSDAAAGQTYELGGPRVATMRELLAYILAQTARPRCMITVPAGLARLQAMVLERMPGKPLTRDQLLLLDRDNVVAQGAAGLAALGVAATPIEAVVPAYLRRYRPGGGVRSEHAA
ncbi:MAG: complex I NDUFA9 subunit family protein [Alphaproteobacteria bacterium]|nr:complex I NDUFA9 subunit family protein [Alphaproteobacteria bacterium]